MTKTLNQLTAITDLADDDLLLARDTSAIEDFKITKANLKETLGVNANATEIAKRTIYVGSVAELEALPSPTSGQEAVVQGVPFRYDGTGWLPSAGFVTVDAFGAVGDGITVNTSAYDDLIAATPNGTKVIWANPDGRYVGDFHATDKYFQCDVNNATLIPVVGGYGIYMEASSAQYDVVETELLPGVTSFTLSGVHTIAEGSLIVLWDNAVRSAGGDVNFEVFEVESSTENGVNTTVNIVGEAEAHKGAGAIVAYHYANPLIAPSIEHMRYENEDSGVTLPAFFIKGAKSPKMRFGYCKGTQGHAFRMQESINCLTWKVKSDRPLDAGSGNGYIATGQRCKNITIKHVESTGARHSIDFSSCYGTVIGHHVVEHDAQSSVVDYCHNGFGSGADIYDVRFTSAGFNYGVSGSDQGYNNAVRSDHPVKNISIRKVRAKYKHAPAAFGNKAVYVRSDGDSLIVDDILVEYETVSTPASLGGDEYVRIDGSYKNCAVDNIAGNVINRALRVSAEGDFVGNLKVKNLDAGSFADPCLIRGYNVDLCDMRYSNPNSATDFIELSSFGGNTPRNATIRDVGYRTTTGSPINPVLNNGIAVLYGTYNGTPMLSSSALDINDTDVISSSDVFNRAGIFKADTGVGTGTVTATLPDPVLYSGQSFLLHVLPSRNTLEFTTGNTTGTISVADGEYATIVADGGFWRQA